APSACLHNYPYEQIHHRQRLERSERLERLERSERSMLRLYNTLTRQEEAFSPSGDETVRMYVCGPTVYARAHIGNFRTYVCVDVLRRTLRYLCGHGVREVINYTDVDDKT